MYTGLKHLHSVLAYFLLAALAFSILYVLFTFVGKKPFTATTRKVSLIGLIAAHLQLVVGLILYFVSPLGFSNFSGENMKNTGFRFHMLEHPLTMLIGIILITIGYSRSKRALLDNQRYKQILVFYIIGLLLILLRIPWTVWP